MTLYGKAPMKCGTVKVPTDEMLFWLYCPISLHGQEDYTLPDNLQQFSPIVDLAKSFIKDVCWKDRYVHITAKTLYVTPDNPGNRPGWHSDGFMTNDLNFIWSDKAPTLFWVQDELVPLTQDCSQSMIEMEELVKKDEGWRVSYEPNMLLLLDESVIHRVPDITKSGMRTFVKISVSDVLYSQLGNSINHKLDYPRPSLVRKEERNCPTGK